MQVSPLGPINYGQAGAAGKVDLCCEVDLRGGETPTYGVCRQISFMSELRLSEASRTLEGLGVCCGGGGEALLERLA